MKSLRMTGLAVLPVSALLSLASLIIPVPSQAQQSDCGADQYPLEHAFSSGAAWSVCLWIEEAHGLSIGSVSYRAPGDSLRPVLAEAHLAQVLMHYHDSREPVAQIDPGLPLPDSTEASDILEFNDNSCQGNRLNVSGHQAGVCSRVRDNRILAKYAQRPSIQSEKLEISSAFQRDTLTWTSSFSFTEDGQILPALSLSGRASQSGQNPDFAQTIPAATPPLTRATLLATWRMVFDLDTPDTDRVEQFDFPLDTDGNNRRPMQVSNLSREALLQVNRGNFRGWRIIDTSGAGYYLDPANSGFSYRSLDLNWAQSDGAITAYHPCERHALLNTGKLRPEDPDSNTIPGCGSSLDDFVDGEALQGVQPALWYSLSRTLDPRIEDWPVLRDISVQFNLTPFDWTAASPFEVND